MMSAFDRHANEFRRHKFPKATYRVTNWPEFEATLLRRASLTPVVHRRNGRSLAGKATGKRGRQTVYSAIAMDRLPPVVTCSDNYECPLGPRIGEGRMSRLVARAAAKTHVDQIASI